MCAVSSVASWSKKIRFFYLKQFPWMIGAVNLNVFGKQGLISSNSKFFYIAVMLFLNVR